jgi:Protein of unknown function (DUF1579)
MKRITTCLVALFLGGPASAQEPPPTPQPSPEHKILSADVGIWDATIKTYMGGPDSEPLVSKGVETNEAMLGGMWVLSRFEGSFGPAKFEGRGQFGYDPVKKKYVGTWIDSMSPSLSTLEGTYDAKSKTITYVGDGYEPSRKSKFTQKMETITKDDGSRVFSLYMKFEGETKETKFMEITYTKRK